MEEEIRIGRRGGEAAEEREREILSPHRRSYACEKLSFTRTCEREKEDNIEEKGGRKNEQGGSREKEGGMTTTSCDGRKISYVAQEKKTRGERLLYLFFSYFHNE